MAGAKRKFEEFEVSEVASAEFKSAIVHGVVTELSPMKKSKKDERTKYFCGALSDGKSCVRVVSFEPSLRSPMDDAFSKKEAVSLVDCQVRRGLGGCSEIVMGKFSKVQASPKKFDTTTLVTEKEMTPVRMNDLSSLVVKQQVIAKLKVKTVDAAETVNNREGKELEKQDCVVGDESGCSRIVLWDVGRLEEGRSYKLIGARVRSFRGTNYLLATGAKSKPLTTSEK